MGDFLWLASVCQVPSSAQHCWSDVRKDISLYKSFFNYPQIFPLETSSDLEYLTINQINIWIKITNTTSKTTDSYVSHWALKIKINCKHKYMVVLQDFRSNLTKTQSCDSTQPMSSKKHSRLRVFYTPHEWNAGAFQEHSWSNTCDHNSELDRNMIPADHFHRFHRVSCADAHLGCTCT